MEDKTTTAAVTRPDSFFDHLEALLKSRREFVAEDGRLLRNKVSEAAATLDPALLRLLLGDAKAKKRFFAEVGTEEKRKVLFELLDANMLYVARSEMDDAEAGLPEADKAFTRSFYGEA